MKIFLTFFLITNCYYFFGQDTILSGATFDLTKRHTFNIYKKKNFTIDSHFGLYHWEYEQIKKIQNRYKTAEESGFEEIYFKGINPVSLGVDYFISNNISLGLTWIYSAIDLTYKHTSQVFDFNSQMYIDKINKIEFFMKRNRLIITGEYHFKNRIKKFDPFIGLSIGANIMQIKVLEDKKTFIGDYNLLSYQLDAFFNEFPVCFRHYFGIAYYMTNRLAIQVQLAMGGSPFSVGLVLKL